ncbi:uncharacterized protein LOC113763453 [Coffea eugenioides]|uniref:uncharacterized protein LOC113763453 n=1 Tax=Coffea eugenioides TaxID=49369 RepID=UPI000F60A7CF|nr:uncharacterized protein LOC113763453 [Coffea eugenioides]
MTIYRTEEEEEALFRSYPCAVYYVQSPSSVSHAYSAEIRNINSESALETIANNPNNASQEAANRLALSRYSSSHGSTNFFLHEKKIPYDHDVQSHGTGVTYNEEINRREGNMVVVDRLRNGYHIEEDHEYEEDEEYFGEKAEWWRMFSFGGSISGGWKFLQMTWRFILSVVIALVVFYIVTKPPAPKMSIKMAGIPQFELVEGVDASGVTTKLLTCNCTVDLVVDNKSKLFGLHIHPPFLAMSFGNLPFALTEAPEFHTGIHDTEMFKLFVGTRNKPMYAAGRSMQDLLESNKGLPLVIHVNLRSSFKVVWGLIKPKFHHEAQCLIILRKAYDKKHRTQEFIGKCAISS